jgi:hypothetical protein
VCFAFRFASLLALLIFLLGTGSAQNLSPTAASVEVQLQVSWWPDAASDHPRVIVVRLDPLQGGEPAQTVRVSESSTAIIRVAPGRYQLTTISPLISARQAFGWSIELPLVSPINNVRLSPENAVRLARGDDLNAAALSGSLPRPVSAASSSDADARRQITALLDKWVNSWGSRNLSAQLSCYGLRLTSYLQQGSVSREQVRQQRQQQLRAYTVQHLELSNLEIQIAGPQATATAIKSWTFSNSEVVSHGRSLIHLGLAKIDSGWLITSEQEYAAPANFSASPRGVLVSNSDVR